VPGLLYGDLMTTAPLGGPLLPAPHFGQVGLLAAWEDDTALDRFLGSHPVAKRLARGWHARLRPTRASGAWSDLPGLEDVNVAMDDDEPVAVITLGRLKLTQAIRFLRTNQPAADLAAHDPSGLAMTALARPPRLVATLSLWETVTAMKAYAYGRGDDAHLRAIKAQRAKTFHHESIFIRFRPYAAHGTWNGREPLSEALPLAAAA
jgi:hypothetical protein